jgi:chromosome segregation ATPase
MTRLKLSSVIGEREQLFSTVTRLESTLSTTRANAEALKSQNSDLTQRLSGSEAAIAAQSTTLTRLDETSEALERLHQVEEELQSVKDTKEKELDKLRFDLKDHHAKTMMGLQVRRVRLILALHFHELTK